MLKNLHVQDVGQILQDLQRPSCMDAKGFVNPDRQCPKKPRGRKPKVPKNETEPPATAAAAASETDKHKSSTMDSIPSAAACGFSTAGKTKEQIAALLAGQVEEKAGNPTKASEGSKAAAAPTETADVKGLEKRAKGQKEKRSTSSTAPAVDPASLDEPKRKKSKTSKCEDTAGNTSGGRKRKGHQQSTKESEPSKKASKRKSRKGKTLKKKKSKMALLKKAEAKAKASRKSSAYHKAVLAAKKIGADVPAQREAGRAVSLS